jgi:uncharacterized protein (TIGR03118 family)
VSDGAVPAAHTDAELQNGWGIAFGPTGDVWVADNNSNVSTLYDGNGVAQSLVVSIPPGGQGPSNPTGTVFNGTNSFEVTSQGQTAPAQFIFVGEGGLISGWAPTVNPTVAITAYDGVAQSAVFKGMTIAENAGSNFLYVTDFRNAKVDVFDASYHLVTVSGGFSDPTLPAGYAPYGIQSIGTTLYVTYALQDAQKHDSTNGAGKGLVDSFDLNGNLLAHVATVGSNLNAPWGVAQAPANFGMYSNDILISNFGDGTIQVYDPATNAYLGPLSTSTGNPVVVHGLWGIAFGNGDAAQPKNTLFFAAGPNKQLDGQYGRIDIVQPPPPAPAPTPAPAPSPY